jgi:hypothetical protein
MESIKMICCGLLAKMNLVNLALAQIVWKDNLKKYAKQKMFLLGKEQVLLSIKIIDCFLVVMIMVKKMIILREFINSRKSISLYSEKIT